MVTAAESAVFDGARLLSWARRSAAELERRRVEINELNVFPVRDADTGSNMAHTMQAALAEADKLGGSATVVEIAEALAVGSMRGARGNSGVVLSQVIRAVAQSVGSTPVDGTVVSDALSSAVAFVDRAISEPVEGTVVTVLRAAAVAARGASESGASLADVASAALAAARTALAKTPSQLDVLRAAGVVDAGGTGLVILLEEFYKEVTGEEPGDAPAESAGGAGESHSEPANLEVMFYFEGPVDELEAAIAPMGTSLVIARADDSRGTVHVHSLTAGRLIETAFSLGAVSDLRLEVLPADPVTENPERLIVAVTPTGSLAQLYAEAGAVTVAPGEDVVSEVLAVIRRSPAREVILLPNGQLGSRELGAIEKAARAFEQTVTVLPTVRFVSGIAALTVHDPDQPLSTVAFTMSEAAGDMRTATLQRSGGDILVTAHGETVRAPGDPGEAVVVACRRLLAHGGEQVSILYAPEEFGAFETSPLADDLGVDVLAYPADGLDALAEIGVE